MKDEYVYALVDPRDDKVSYVGATNNLMYRWRDHMKKRNRNRRLSDWLDELVLAGLTPKFRVLEATHPLFRNRREIYWMRKFYLEGHPIKNVIGFTKWLNRPPEEQLNYP